MPLDGNQATYYLKFTRLRNALRSMGLVKFPEFPQADSFLLLEIAGDVLDIRKIKKGGDVADLKVGFDEQARNPFDAYLPDFVVYGPVDGLFKPLFQHASAEVSRLDDVADQDFSLCVFPDEADGRRDFGVIHREDIG